MKVVIVEDYDRLVRLLKQALVSAGHEVIVGGDPKSWCKQGAEVVLLDMHLDGQSNGLTILERIRKECPELMVIVTTGSGDSERKRQVEEFGAVWLAKPYSFEELKRELKKLEMLL